MSLPRRMSPLLALILAIGAAQTAEAQNCLKGKPCGNTCIAREKVCRVGPGTARWAPGADTTTGVGPQGQAAGLRVDSSTAPSISGIPPDKRAACVVASITDGDTFRCAGGRRVRLLLVDTPEPSQPPFGARATRGLRALIKAGDNVVLELDVEARDRYGRTLAYAYLHDGRMVNEEMARQGLAVVSIYPPNVKHVERIRAAVAEARQAKRSLWSTSAFECTPAAHRRGRC